jgi:hypothetical protein
MNRLIFALALAAGLTAEQERPRVYVTDSESWEMSGGAGAVDGTGGGAVRGGARPQTVEIMKTVKERCPGVIVTSEKERADYVIMLEKEGGKGNLRRDNKVAVFNREGDLIETTSTRSLGNAIKEACKAIPGSGAR